MKLKLEFDPRDVDRVRAVVTSNANHPIVVVRRPRPERKPSERRLWRAQLMCLLTTQNKSGFGSPVEEFLKQRPFPLALRRCREAGDGVAQHMYSALEHAEPGMRRWKIIAGAA